VPFDDTHLHFGKGQTEASIVLAPGKHKLTLQFANALHKRRVALSGRGEGLPRADAPSHRAAATARGSPRASRSP